MHCLVQCCAQYQHILVTQNVYLQQQCTPQEDDSVRPGRSTTPAYLNKANSAAPNIPMPQIRSSREATREKGVHEVAVLTQGNHAVSERSRKAERPPALLACPPYLELVFSACNIDLASFPPCNRNTRHARHPHSSNTTIRRDTKRSLPTIGRSHRLRCHGSE